MGLKNKKIRKRVDSVIGMFDDDDDDDGADEAGTKLNRSASLVKASAIGGHKPGLHGATDEVGMKQNQNRTASLVKAAAIGGHKPGLHSKNGNAKRNKNLLLKQNARKPKQHRSASLDRVVGNATSLHMPGMKQPPKPPRTKRPDKKLLREAMDETTAEARQKLTDERRGLIHTASFIARRRNVMDKYTGTGNQPTTLGPSDVEDAYGAHLQKKPNKPKKRRNRKGTVIKKPKKSNKGLSKRGTVQRKKGTGLEF